MSLWMLLLIVLLTVTAVVFFSFSMSATDPRAKRRYRIIATIALVAAVGLVVMGVLRGRKVVKKGKRVRFENNDEFNNDEFNNDLNNDNFNDDFFDDFDDLPRPGIDKSVPATADATALLSV